MGDLPFGRSQFVKNLMDWKDGGKKQGEYEGTGVPSC